MIAGIWLAVLTMQTDRKIVAVALLTRADVARLGSTLKQLYKVDSAPHFTDLLNALDEAERREPGYRR